MTISLTEVNVEVVIAGLPNAISVPAVSSPSPVAVLPPSAPTAASKSAGVPIGAVAGGIAGGAIVIGEQLLAVLLVLALAHNRQRAGRVLSAHVGHGCPCVLAL